MYSGHIPQCYCQSNRISPCTFQNCAPSRHFRQRSPVGHPSCHGAAATSASSARQTPGWLPPSTIVAMRPLQNIVCIWVWCTVRGSLRSTRYPGAEPSSLAAWQLQEAAHRAPDTTNVSQLDKVLSSWASTTTPIFSPPGVLFPTPPWPRAARHSVTWSLFLKNRFNTGQTKSPTNAASGTAHGLT